MKKTWYIWRCICLVLAFIVGCTLFAEARPWPAALNNNGLSKSEEAKIKNEAIAIFKTGMELYADGNPRTWNFLSDQSRVILSQLAASSLISSGRIQSDLSTATYEVMETLSYPDGDLAPRYWAWCKLGNSHLPFIKNGKLDLNEFTVGVGSDKAVYFFYNKSEDFRYCYMVRRSIHDNNLDLYLYDSELYFENLK